MGYYEEKKNYEAENIKPSINKCSKCNKGILVVTTTFPSWKFGKTTFKSFCPVCGNTIKKEI